jgi:hypothetical protein
MSWPEHNREFLAYAIDDLHARIHGDPDPYPRERLTQIEAAMEVPPALTQLTEAFDLGGFERDVVALTLAAELDPRFQDGPPTVATVLETLADGHWAALDAGAPLRAWGVITQDGTVLADATLKLAPDVLRFLMGFDPRRDRDAAFTLQPLPPAVVTSQVEQAEDIAQAIGQTLEATGQTPAIELYGAAPDDRLAIAALTAAALAAELVSADARDLPAPGPELDRLLHTWSRIARLTSTLLCITDADARDEDPTLRHRVDRALSRIKGPFVVCVERPTVHEPDRPLVRREVQPLTADERLELWTLFAPEATEDLEALAGDFRLGARAIQRVAAGTTTLREGCAQAVRARLDPLTERIDVHDVTPVALPPEEARQLEQLEQAIRLATQVSHRWGIGRGRPTAITALFAGPSGTGKTHAALALARRLGLDLYRVDLAGILSKYIGETEKNLDKIFDAAEVGGVILLFDEADALFGKRSEVRDSHDRYANLGTAYLLARMERAPAPTILTTNLKDAIDPAFQRRLQFVIDFPFPAERERERIWRTIYPQQTPVEDLVPQQLAVVAATGGTIANIARRGAFLAAAEPAPVEMRHLFEATRLELTKLGRDMTPEEREAWPLRST